MKSLLLVKRFIFFVGDLTATKLLAGYIKRLKDCFIRTEQSLIRNDVTMTTRRKTYLISRLERFRKKIGGLLHTVAPIQLVNISLAAWAGVSRRKPGTNRNV